MPSAAAAAARTEPGTTEVRNLRRETAMIRFLPYPASVRCPAPPDEVGAAVPQSVTATLSFLNN
jgi:hypothetical protein